MAEQLPGINPYLLIPNPVIRPIHSSEICYSNGDFSMTLANAENGWINTADSRSPAILAQAQKIIETTLYCTLSTCSSDGVPWASPVFYTFDSELTLYWSSTVVAQHSQNIYQNNGRTAVAVYSTHQAEGKGQGVYFQGIAGELASGQVSRVMQNLFRRAGGDPPHRTAQDYLHPSPRRIYQFVPSDAWITGPRVPIGNQLVDTKIQLDINEFRRQDL